MRVLHRPAGSYGGKPGALNAAAEIARGEILVVFDADHIPRRNVIERLVRHFQDPKVSAVQGRCIVRNSVQSKLARSIAIDYFSGYLVNEYGRQALFELPAYGGANCAVRASTLRRLGGWNTESVTEDTDLTLRVVMLGDRVRYDITAVDTEEGATTLRRFISQRYRWARGHQQVWRDYRGYVLRTPHLSRLEKVETMLFLLVYHVPVLCTMTLLMTVLRIAGIGPTLTIFELLPLAALLFAGPFCELAVGLMVGRAPRRSAWSIAWMTPIFFVFMLVCTKAWVDGLLGRQYAWVKTARSSWSALDGAEDDFAACRTRRAMPTSARRWRHEPAAARGVLGAGHVARRRRRRLPPAERAARQLEAMLVMVTLRPMGGRASVVNDTSSSCCRRTRAPSARS